MEFRHECKTRSVVNVKLVDFLQRQTLGLWNKGEDKEDGEDHTAEEDKSICKVNGFRDKWSEKGNQESPDPVGRLGNTHTLLSNSQWVGFRNNDEDTWTPRGGEEEDVETREENHGISHALVWIHTELALVQRLGTDGCENDQANGHTDSTTDQSESSSETVNNKQRADGGGKVDNTKDNRGLERVVQTHRLEDGGTIVEEIVVTRQLLQRLQDHTNQQSVENLWLTGDQLAPRCGTGLALNLNGVQNDGSLVLDELGVDSHLVDLGHRPLGILESVFLDQISWRLRHKRHTEDHQEGPCETQTQRNSPLSRVVVVVVGTVGRAVTKEDTESNHKLVAGNKSTSDLLRRGLRDEHWTQHRNGTDGQTRDDSADEKLHPRRNRSDLDDNTNNVNHHGEHKTDLSTLDVSESTKSKTTESTTDVENGDHQTGSHIGEVVLALTVDLTETTLEIWHVDETRNGTGIPSEDETTESDQ
ncbi:hypothetical protein KL929_000813 [Ogataea haglerorum]|nr:hypothetical protein KL951_000305 [Ogataea haglerorum]KAG7751115.1 hypothetical protein KL912_000248 [Ogataea haglerorum]KAG7799897.1 hypothetical protein KL929_000813 [Ogataea haglerorum]KAG7804012.1 hypothetical protein KL944_000881 [Ogataea haglerorum]